MTTCRGEQLAQLLSDTSVDLRPPDTGPMDVLCSDGAMVLHIDLADENSYIDAPPGHPCECMTEIFPIVDAFGLELLTEDECEPYRRPDGITRIYLAEKPLGMMAA